MPVANANQAMNQNSEVVFMCSGYPVSVSLEDRFSLPEIQRHHLNVTLLTIVGLVLYLYGLGIPALVRWDGAIYASAARFALQDGHWIIPHVYWRGQPHLWQPFLDKPPLVYWLQALSIAVFGVTSFAAKLPSALATVALAVLVYLIGTDRYDEFAGLAAGFLLLGLPPAFFISHGGRTAATDMPLALFGTAFVWCVWKGRENGRYLLWAGVFGALAVLAKGVAASVFLAIAIPIVLVGWRDYSSRQFAGGVLVGLAVALPWFVAAAVLRGDVLYSQMIADQVIRRATGAKSASGGPATLIPRSNYPFFRRFPIYYRLTRYLVLGAAGALAISLPARRDGWRSDAVLLWWLFAVPFVYSFAGGNHKWYLLPSIVPAALIVGRVGSVAVGVLNDIVRPRIGQSPINYQVFVVLTLVGLAALVAIPGHYPPSSGDPIGSYNTEQRAIGNTFANLAEPGETVYVDDEIRTNLVVFSYQVGRQLEGVDTEGLNENEDVRLALVATDHLSDLRRDYQTVGEVPTADATAIRFT